MAKEGRRGWAASAAAVVSLCASCADGAAIEGEDRELHVASARGGLDNGPPCSHRAAIMLTPTLYHILQGKAASSAGMHCKEGLQGRPVASIISWSSCPA